MPRTEEKVREYFKAMASEATGAMDENVREDYPIFTQRVDQTIDECKTMLNEAFIHSAGDEGKCFQALEGFANRLVSLEKALGEPELSGAVNARTIENASRGIRQTLARYEIYFPRPDEDLEVILSPRDRG